MTQWPSDCLQTLHVIDDLSQLFPLPLPSFYALPPPDFTSPFFPLFPTPLLRFPRPSTAFVCRSSIPLWLSSHQNQLEALTDSQKYTYPLSEHDKDCILSGYSQLSQIISSTLESWYNDEDSLLRGREYRDARVQVIKNGRQMVLDLLKFSNRKLTFF